MNIYKLYLDTCCYGRLYDNLTEDIQVLMEAGAIMQIVVLARAFGYIIYGSMAVEDEIEANQDESKRMDARGFYDRTVTARANHVESVLNHYVPLARAVGIRGQDIFHLCYAIASDVDYLITTDKKFLKAAAKLTLPIKVINPMNFPIGG